MKKILYTFIILLLTSCLGNNLQQAYQMSSEQFSQKTVVKRGTFNSGPIVESMILKDGLSSFFLRSTSKNVHVIYFYINYGEYLRPPGGGSSWIFYENARLAGGKTLRMESVDRNHSCDSSCFFTEQSVIYVDPLNDNLNQIEVSGKNFRNPVIIQFPSAYIQSHINAVNTNF